MKHSLIFFGALALIVVMAILNLKLIVGSNDDLYCQKGIWILNGRAIAGNSEVPCQATRSSLPAKTDDNPNVQVGGTDADIIRQEIHVTSPEANTIITSPLTVEGEAKGNWFFEASFPVKLIGEDGEVLARTVAQAQSDWTKIGFVPFKAVISFTPGSSTAGMLVLANDNPSGLPENEKQYGIPVRLSRIEKLVIKTFFGNNDFNPNSMDCSLVYGVDRTITKTKLTARAAIEQLLAGPTEEEKAKGYYTSLNQNIRLNNIVISDGTAKVDFDSQLESGIAGSCRVAAIRAQIIQTLKQFPSVKDVVISVDGRSGDILQP